MKKILFTLVLLFSFITVQAQVYQYRTFQYAYQKTDSYGNWLKWTEWEPSNMLITISFDNDYIIIYSPKIQTFKITEHIRTYTDNSGGRQVEFSAIDGDSDKCHIRLRIETNKNSQLYVDYANLRLCWNVRRIDK